MRFNNAGLHYVHSIFHKLIAVYNLPPGVCCVIRILVIELENAKCVPKDFQNLANALGFHKKRKII
jgi:alcohol dehydrogenase, iron-dependent